MYAFEGIVTTRVKYHLYSEGETDAYKSMPGTNYKGHGRNMSCSILGAKTGKITAYI